MDVIFLILDLKKLEKEIRIFNFYNAHIVKFIMLKKVQRNIEKKINENELPSEYKNTLLIRKN